MVYYPWRLSREQQQELYGDDYFDGREYLDYLADRGAHEATSRDRVRRLERWLPPSASLFEIGCCFGFFLDAARRVWKVRGCDIALGPCTYARETLGLSVDIGDFREIDLNPGEVDAFCLWDTIEHLDAADDYLSRISTVLEPGGLLALTTGDIGSLLARWQGERWRQIHPPTHLWYFSGATIRRTLERFGFEVLSIEQIGVARSVGQAVYGFTSLERGSPSWIYRLCVRTRLDRCTFWLNTLDLMMVVARRR